MVFNSGIPEPKTKEGKRGFNSSLEVILIMMQLGGIQDTVIESALKDFHDLKLKVSELNLSAASLQKLQESKILSDLSLE